MGKISVSRSHCTMTMEFQEGLKIPLQDCLCDLEKAILKDTLERSGGVKAQAADRLTLNRTTFVEKARKYGFPLKKRQ